jgi:hypothetical protein
MLMKSFIYFRGDTLFAVGKRARGRLVLGDSARVAPLRTLGIAEKPLFTAFMPSTTGVLDDHYEGWFLTTPEPIEERPEGLESVVDLGLSEEWLADPPATPAGRKPTARKPTARKSAARKPAAREAADGRTVTEVRS